VALSGLFIYLSNSYLSYGVVNEWLMLVNKLQIFIADYVLFFNRIIVSLRRMKNHEPIDDIQIYLSPELLRTPVCQQNKSKSDYDDFTDQASK